MKPHGGTIRYRSDHRRPRAVAGDTSAVGQLLKHREPRPSRPPSAAIRITPSVIGRSANEARNRKTKPIIAAGASMTSFRQIEANRRNARKSTGPITEEGKQRSRCNAVRHGLTAETVIGALEDAEDYKAFEAAIIADYDAQSAVERELVLRLASLLWRLRRATTMETGLFEIQADQLREFRQARQIHPDSREIVYAMFGRADPVDADPDRASHGITNGTEAVPSSGPRTSSIPPLTSRVAFCASPICPTSRSTGSAAMKQSFGAKPARSCLPSMHWIAANHKIEGAVSVSVAGKTLPADGPEEC